MAFAWLLVVLRFGVRGELDATGGGGWSGRSFKVEDGEGDGAEGGLVEVRHDGGRGGEVGERGGVNGG